SGIDLALTGCVLDGNSARRSGGGLAGDGTLTNCTFTGNSAGEAGGGIYGTGSLNNCVLWGNTSLLGTTESAQIAWFGANPPLVAYSCIQGLEVYGGNHNIDRNPLFVDADGPDDVPGTEDDDLRLSPGSPCIDAGDNDAVPPDSLDLDDDGDTEEPVPLDLDGGPRFLDDPNTSDTGNFGELGPPVVDMGAYEFRATVIVPLDIMPQRCPNRLPFKKKGILRIALLGTDWFDVMQVDPASLVLTRADGVGGAIAPLRTPPGPARKIRDVATPLNGEPCECHHLGKDGIDDLLLHIRGDKEIRALELRSVPDNTYVELILSGALWDGTAIEASDCVLVKHPTTTPTAASPRRKGRPRTP
ncbi:MAG: hypothetical protein IH987_19170, partial [Planctomycetes bacterium]|nr:hypothetical protein [Planctomycetota bacterium]